ncbi:hypothetical protein [Pseudonocardia endophytica]|uniref:Uncharacterized protein n=1 Tax=Pseudonocardia endophytica TaxID=401976 RepID=A0A4R1HVM3_PSEEN|nr:hypothetical protein [Pseudonocardia endophytica]TCK24770.1 hypothetical protein EV378_0563 [Pseudonocardia endophytica]
MLRVDQKRRGLAGADFVAHLDGREVASWHVGVNWTGGRRPQEVTVDGERCELRIDGRERFGQAAAGAAAAGS